MLDNSMSGRWRCHVAGISNYGWKSFKSDGHSWWVSPPGLHPISWRYALCPIMSCLHLDPLTWPKHFFPSVLVSAMIRLPQISRQWGWKIHPNVIILLLLGIFAGAALYVSEDISLTFRRAAPGVSGPPAKRQKSLGERCHGSNHLRRVVKAEWTWMIGPPKWTQYNQFCHWLYYFHVICSSWVQIVHGIAYFGFANALSGQEDTIILCVSLSQMYFSQSLICLSYLDLFGLLLMIYGVQCNPIIIGLLSCDMPIGCRCNNFSCLTPRTDGPGSGSAYATCRDKCFSFLRIYSMYDAFSIWYTYHGLVQVVCWKNSPNLLETLLWPHLCQWCGGQKVNGSFHGCRSGRCLPLWEKILNCQNTECENWNKFAPTCF